MALIYVTELESIEPKDLDYLVQLPKDIKIIILIKSGEEQIPVQILVSLSKVKCDIEYINKPTSPTISAYISQLMLQLGAIIATRKSDLVLIYPEESEVHNVNNFYMDIGNNEYKVSTYTSFKNGLKFGKLKQLPKKETKPRKLRTPKNALSESAEKSHPITPDSNNSDSNITEKTSVPINSVEQTQGNNFNDGKQKPKNIISVSDAFKEALLAQEDGSFPLVSNAEKIKLCVEKATDAMIGLPMQLQMYFPGEDTKTIYKLIVPIYKKLKEL